MHLLERCTRPMWIYSYNRERIAWANAPGLAFWDAGSRGEVSERDVRPTSVGVAQRLRNLRDRLAETERVEELWTLYPNGVPKSVVVSASLVALDDGDLGLLCEALPQEGAAVPSELAHHLELRAIEAVNNASLMISLMTPAGGWLMHNPAAEALMRRLGRNNIPNVDNYLALYSDRGAAADLRQRALEGGAARGPLRIMGRIPRYHDVSLRRIIDPVTGHVAITLSQVDISRAKLLERRLARALRNERAMSESQRQFLSLTSHEFRTPLAIIASSVRRLRQTIGSHDGVRPRLDTIAAAVSRMQDAAEKTLLGGKIDAQKVLFQPRPLQLAEVVGRAVAIQQELHPERSFVVQLSEMPEITGDAGLIEQAVDNLLSNALKFSPKGGAVEVTGGREPDALAITVRDHGLGIPEGDLPNMFSRFFRASNADGIKGTGIGLTAVHHFMDMHGGTVALSSREGEGTSVTLRFPLPR